MMTRGKRSASCSVAMSPDWKTQRSASPRFVAFSWAIAIILGEMSMPVTAMPSRAMGRLMRPVPQPSSRTGPPDSRASST